MAKKKTIEIEFDDESQEQQVMAYLSQITGKTGLDLDVHISDMIYTHLKAFIKNYFRNASDADIEARIGKKPKPAVMATGKNDKP